MILFYLAVGRGMEMTGVSRAYGGVSHQEPPQARYVRLVAPSQQNCIKLLGIGVGCFLQWEGEWR